VAPGARGAGPLFTGDPRVGPELRLILGAEDEVHTWLGIFGKPGASAVGRGERAALTALAPRLLAELERTRAPTADVHGAIALDAEGQIIAADARAGPWLEAEGRRRRLPTLLRVGRAGDAVEGPLDGARLRLRAARGRLGPIWLGSISSPAPLERALDALLTRTQREVASYAAVGATCAEIASTLGTRVETVRTHVRDIYARLGISTRAELARRWAPLMDDEGAPTSLAS
jgi:DNA-binding CsgD family transcriptional regulator